MASISHDDLRRALDKVPKNHGNVRKVAIKSAAATQFYEAVSVATIGDWIVLNFDNQIDLD